MFKLISGLINLNAALAQKARSVIAYDEASSFYDAKKFKEAFPLMTEASELGNTEAMALLGTMYLLGQGVRENGQEALKWLQRSVDGGYEAAISVLGMALATGKAGVPRDLPRAIEMLSACAAKGDEKSAQMLSMIENGEGMFAKRNRR